MTSRQFQERLRRRARKAGVSMTPGLADALERYYRVLAAWNQKINLTGHDLADPTAEAIDRLFIEPLAAARYVPPGTWQLIDIGSGGGSPAIPLALSLSGTHLRMVEAKTRKSVFLREALRALEMAARAEVIAARAEELVQRSELIEAHDLLTIRAVRVEPALLALLERLLTQDGRMFLFRSAESPEVVVPQPLVIREAHPLLESLHSRLTVLQRQS